MTPPELPGAPDDPKQQLFQFAKPISIRLRHKSHQQRTRKIGDVRTQPYCCKQLFPRPSQAAHLFQGQKGRGGRIVAGRLVTEALRQQHRPLRRSLPKDSSAPVRYVCEGMGLLPIYHLRDRGFRPIRLPASRMLSPKHLAFDGRKPRRAFYGSD